MAKILTEDILKNLKKFDLPKGYQRTGEFPLDPSSVFGSKADAELYAAGGADSRGLSGTRYAGQLIAVQENGATVLYTVENNDKLKPVVGAVSDGLSDITNKVNAILDGTSIDSFKDVEDKFAALPKDMVVSGGEVRVPTEAEIEADSTLVANEKYIILTIANAEAGKDKLYIKAKDLVDVYKGSDYVAVSDTNVISLKVTELEAKLVTDEFAKKSDITDSTSTLATTEALNAVKSTAEAAASKADANEGRIGTLETTVGSADSGLVKEVADVKAALATKVENTIKINEKALTGNITLDGADIKVGGEGDHKTTTIAASVEDLYTKVAAAATSGVTKFAGKTGEITVKTAAEADANGTVQFAMSEAGQLSATVKGLGSAAYTNSNAYDAAGTAAGVKTAIVGTAEDASTVDTIKGAKKYADEKVKTVSDALAATTATANNAVKSVVAAEGDKYVSVATAENVVTISSKGIDDAIAAVKGNKTKDTSTSETVYGAIALAKEKATPAQVDEKITAAAGNYATKAQGTKADTALQSVSATGDSYVSASFAAKASGAQALTVATTVQAVSGASADAKGLAEASDVKSYVDSYKPTTLTWTAFA